MNGGLIPVERFLLRAVGRTDVGAQRTQNEDAMYYDDFLGVYIKATHDYYTGLFGTTLTITESGINLLEPDSFGVAT